MRLPCHLRHWLPPLLLFSPAPAMADAWTLPKRHHQWTLYQSQSRTEKYFDDNGDRQVQLRYYKYEFSPRLEYGLSNDLTLGATTSLQHVEQDVSFGHFYHYDLGDSEFYLRRRLWRNDHISVSLQPLIKLPSPRLAEYSRTPRIGSVHPDAAMGLAAGYSFDSGDKHYHFAEISLQYRYRFDQPLDQIRINTSAGVSVTRQVVILPQMFVTLRRKDPVQPAFTQTPGDDYDLAKLQLSVVYKFRNGVDAQAGFFRDTWGKNTGLSHGFVLTVGSRF